MSNKTRKGIRPAFLVAALGVVAMLAVMAALLLPSGPANAQTSPFTPVDPSDVNAVADSSTQVTVTWTAAPGGGPVHGYELQRKTGSGSYAGVDPAHADTTPSYTDSSVSAGTTYTYRVRATNNFDQSGWVESNEVSTPPDTVTTPTPDPDDSIASSSTTGGASVRLTLAIGSPGDLLAGSSVALYLEDDFQVPGDIDPSTVYFVGQNTGRVYVVDDIEIEDDDHFDGDDDWDLQVFVPDRLPDNDEGFDSWSADQTEDLELIFTKAAGIKNPTEQGSHSAHYAVLAPGASVPTLDNPNAGARNLADLKTWAKISLSDEDNGRGAEITVTGTGFNNGTGAEVRVLIDGNADPEDDSTWPSCEAIMTSSDSASLGEAVVGSDDKFTVTFTVHQDDFDAGEVNYICAADAEADTTRFAREVKLFELEGSLTVSPTSANYGDEITLAPRDTGTVTQINIGPRHVWNADGSCPTDSNKICMAHGDIDPDGDDFVFDLPGGLDERVQIAVIAAAGTERVYLNVEASSLSLSQDEVAPNASIIISGSGFTENSEIRVSDITIDDEPLVVDDAGTVSCDEGSGDCVQVTSSGEFTATVRVWTASASNNNPTLDDDTYTIKVVDQGGFEGEVDVTINEPTVSVSPDTASPRDFIVISGENWPISTPELDNSVRIEVDGRTRTADVDSTGRFRYEYQLRATIKIGDEHDVTVTYEDPEENANRQPRDDIEEETTFNVTEAELDITPAAAAPGQSISVSVQGMPPYSLINEITVGRVNMLGNQSITTDREGDATASGLIVPFLDPGHYPVTVKVDNETRVSQLEVLAEALVPGVAATLPDAVSDLGDNLDAIFHFNNANKEWTFYDPRPEFADLNTLGELNSGQPYWVLVKDSQMDVDWNGRLVSFTCAGGDCWNLEIW